MAGDLRQDIFFSLNFLYNEVVKTAVNFKIGCLVSSLKVVINESGGKKGASALD